jgi:hypothetical protein
VIDRIEEFKERLAEKSDDQLIQILGHSDQYETKVVALVRQEVDKRDLGNITSQELEERVQAIHEEEEEIANLPLQ